MTRIVCLLRSRASDVEPPVSSGGARARPAARCAREFASLPSRLSAWRLSQTCDTRVRGDGAPEGAGLPSSRPRSLAACAATLRLGDGILLDKDAPPSDAPPRRLTSAGPRFASRALHRSEKRRSASSWQRPFSSLGRSPGTAREQGYEPCAQAPHSLPVRHVCRTSLARSERG